VSPRALALDAAIGLILIVAILTAPVALAMLVIGLALLGALALIVLAIDALIGLMERGR
jgi:hypothetical protein